MKTLLKIISAFLLAVSCLFFSLTLFLNRFMTKDVIPSLVTSSTMTATLVDVCDEPLSSIGLNDQETKQFVSLIQNDVQTKEVLENYIQTLVYDLLEEKNTFDEKELLSSLENKKDMAYEILKPDISKEIFDQQYNRAIEKIDFQQMHQQVINKVNQKFAEDSSIRDLLDQFYQFYQIPSICISLLLIMISTGYLVYTSLKENQLLTSSLMIMYILSGIITFILAFVIVLVLSMMIPSTMSIQITSMKYMYLCGGIYIFIGIIGYILNVLSKRRI